jgi:hypothetical protein
VAVEAGEPRGASTGASPGCRRRSGPRS